MSATNNALGAKGPCGDRADGAGKREGMTGETGSNVGHSTTGARSVLAMGLAAVAVAAIRRRRRSAQV